MILDPDDLGLFLGIQKRFKKRQAKRLKNHHVEESKRKTDRPLVTDDLKMLIEIVERLLQR